MAKKFQRRIEDFSCHHCGAHVKGNGYTDHCPHCLWSKHVDVNPGDRASDCGGLMEPILLEGSSPEYRILYRCIKCGYERVNKVQDDDGTEALFALAQHPHLLHGDDIDAKTGLEGDPLAQERRKVEKYYQDDRGD